MQPKSNSLQPMFASSQQSLDRGSQDKAFELQDLSSHFKAKLWVLWFDLPKEKVNKLDRRVMNEFEGVLGQLEQMAPKIDALLFCSRKSRNFISGADIKMIQATQNVQEAQALSEGGQKLANRWEDLPFPTIAAVNGAALGGGCELALASTAIVMSTDPSAKIGLPEVLLGVLPGMGGCIRLPRRLGIAQSLDLILNGKSYDGKRAQRIGLCDALLSKENFEWTALNWVKNFLPQLKARKNLAQKPKLGGMGGFVGWLLECTPFGRMVVFGQAKKGVLKKTYGHYPAALEVVEIMRSTGVGYLKRFKGGTRDRAMKREAMGFGKCAATDVSKNLIRLFFMTEDVKKSNGVSSSGGGSNKEVRTAGVLGAGVMGGGIAQLFAAKEIPIRMKDLNIKGLETGVQSALRLWKKQLQQKRLSPRDVQQKLNLIAPTLTYEGFRSLDLVVEAVLEKMEVKKSVFQELEKVVSPDCVVATNTSSLSVTEMQTVFQKPERFVGMHFFNPVHRMPLIEVIRGEKTSDEAVITVYELSKKIGKTPVVVKDAPGFLVNRLLCPYMNEAAHLFSEGCPIEVLDRALKRFGMPMGPLELIDEVGVDVGDKVLKILFQAFGPRMAPANRLEKLVQAGRLGKKNGKGIYLYKGKDARQKVLDPEVYSLLGIQKRSVPFTENEMIERCILPMINEGARCLDEKIVGSPAELDLAMIMGTGFPPFRGGLMRYADSLGAAKIVERLQLYDKLIPERFKPSESILKRARANQTFHN